jgi:regulator of protease activity HflC (stomatin/prohibitin superfamily)
MDVLLNQRTAIGGQIRELIVSSADVVGVRVHGVDVRDVMLPGELRKAFSEVLKAKQEAQVTLERARSESAALRNLANAARLVENVPALATLRFFQSLESSGSRTVVMNDLSSFLPALTRQFSKPTETEGSEG